MGIVEFTLMDLVSVMWRPLVVDYLPWLLSAITISTMFLAGSVNKATWLVGLVNQALWLIWIFAAEAWGLLPMNAALWIVYARNHFKWRKLA